MTLDFGFAWKTVTNSWPMYWYGIKITILLAIVGTLFGLLIGLIVGALRGMPSDPLDTPAQRFWKKLGRGITWFYIWVFRGTPMMVQAVFFYYLLRSVLHWTPLTAGMIIISVNTGAYMSEIIRSGIQSVDKGQVEAAKSLGMTNLQTMLLVVFPQAIKNTLPSIGNQLIVNIKDSCMLNAIGVTELYFQATSIAGSTMRYIEVYFVTALIYLTLTTLATLLLDFIERRINGSTAHKDFAS